MSGGGGSCDRNPKLMMSRLCRSGGGLTLNMRAHAGTDCANDSSKHNVVTRSAHETVCLLKRLEGDLQSPVFS